MTQAAIETVWRSARRARINQFPISDNLAALMALVMADLSESQKETFMNLIYQRDIELTALTLQQLRDFLITQLHALKSSLENPSWAHWLEKTKGTQNTKEWKIRVSVALHQLFSNSLQVNYISVALHKALSDASMRHATLPSAPKYMTEVVFGLTNFK